MENPRLGRSQAWMITDFVRLYRARPPRPQVGGAMENPRLGRSQAWMITDFVRRRLSCPGTSRVLLKLGGEMFGGKARSGWIPGWASAAQLSGYVASVAQARRGNVRREGQVGLDPRMSEQGGQRVIARIREVNLLPVRRVRRAADRCGPAVRAGRPTRHREDPRSQPPPRSASASSSRSVRASWHRIAPTDAITRIGIASLARQSIWRAVLICATELA